MNIMPATLTQKVGVYLQITSWESVDSVNLLDTSRPSAWNFCVHRGEDSTPVQVRISDDEMCNFISKLKMLSPYGIINTSITENKFTVFRGDREILLSIQSPNIITDENEFIVRIPARCIMAEYYNELNTIDFK